MKRYVVNLIQIYHDQLESVEHVARKLVTYRSAQAVWRLREALSLLRSAEEGEYGQVEVKNALKRVEKDIAMLCDRLSEQPPEEQIQAVEQVLFYGSFMLSQVLPKNVSRVNVPPLVLRSPLSTRSQMFTPRGSLLSL